MKSNALTAEPTTWRSAWPDFLAFAAFLSLAWGLHWRTTDLVWSLWLSSLLVGYAMIFWGIFRPILRQLTTPYARKKPVGEQLVAGGLYVAGGMGMLGFFTIHFGGFHLVHSVFLYGFFPLNAGERTVSPEIYLEVLRRYWPFVFFAALAERQAFKWSSGMYLSDDASPKGNGNVGIAAPYLNVIRMHLLIFFFVFAKVVHLDNAWIYVVVYAVYFFPWRLLRRTKPAVGGL